MSDFDPGDGWREVFTEYERIVPALRYVDGINEPRWFVREKPVPPLPTEPYTVIRVTWNDGSTGHRTLNEDGSWDGISPGYLAEDITGFKVLAEPTPRVALYEEQERVTRDVTERVRRETAKAVLDRVREEDVNDIDATETWNRLAAEFGVES